MISIGKYVLNPKEVVAVSVEGATVRVYMTAAVHSDGRNVIVEATDGPDEAHALKEEIITTVHGFITSR